MKTIAGLLFILALSAAGFLVFIYSGVYNVAASDPHSGPLRWLFTTTLDHSVRTHAVAINPAPLARVNKEEGFRQFHAVCVTCHGAPGVSPSEIGSGLRPEPPDLAERADDWPAAELFWIVKHGFKFTGMPGFGATHPDERVWNIVAFVKELPALSPEAYQSLAERLGTLPEQPRLDEPPSPLQPYEQDEVIIRRQAI